MVAVIVIALSTRDRCEVAILVDLVSSASSVVEAWSPARHRAARSPR
jgi:hypothetical protein